MRITQHALQRVLERVGIRDQQSAEFFISKAKELGYHPSAFPAGSLVKDFLEAKCRRGGSAVIYMGIVVVFGSDGCAITAYPLPAPLLEHYRKEIDKHD